jgi:hypothetical protein
LFWIGLRPIVFNNRDDATIHLAVPNARRKTTKIVLCTLFRRVVAVIKKQAAKLRFSSSN